MPIDIFEAAADGAFAPNRLFWLSIPEFGRGDCAGAPLCTIRKAPQTTDDHPQRIAARQYSFQATSQCEGAFEIVVGIVRLLLARTRTDGTVTHDGA